MLAAASPSTRTWSLAELVGLVSRKPFQQWLLAQALVVGIASVIVSRGPARRRAAPCLSIVAGLFGGCTVLCGKMIGELVGAGVGRPATRQLPASHDLLARRPL